MCCQSRALRKRAPSSRTLELGLILSLLQEYRGLLMLRTLFRDPTINASLRFQKYFKPVEVYHLLAW
jgi:hypothetical protein